MYPLRLYLQDESDLLLSAVERLSSRLSTYVLRGLLGALSQEQGPGTSSGQKTQSYDCDASGERLGTASGDNGQAAQYRSYATDAKCVRAGAKAIKKAEGGGAKAGEGGAKAGTQSPGPKPDPNDPHLSGVEETSRAARREAMRKQKIPTSRSADREGETVARDEHMSTMCQSPAEARRQSS